MWLVALPIIAFTSGHLGKIVFQSRSKKTNNLTGLNNKQGFFEDLLKEAKGAIKRKLDIAIIMIKLANYKELSRIYGESKIESAILMAENVLEETMRSEDKNYRLEKDVLAIILPYSDYKVVEMIKLRLLVGLSKISITVGKERRTLKFEVEVEILDYDQEDNDLNIMKSKQNMQ